MSIPSCDTKIGIVKNNKQATVTPLNRDQQNHGSKKMESHLLMNNNSSVFTSVEKQSDQEVDCYRAYASVMFFILTSGFLGNLLTIIVFLQKEQRTKVIAPFVINLAVADLFIVIFGYPVAITANLSGLKLTAGESRCTWIAFVNGATGIASIVMLTEISVLMCYNITSMRPTLNPSELASKKFKIAVLAGAWVYGILSMSPPLFGWSRFVPGSARISCGPEWGSNNMEALSYNIGLVIVGFFLPMAIILTSHYKIYSSLTVSAMLAQDEALIRRRRHSQFKVARMIAVAILAFFISWSPYCIVSLAAVFNNNFMLHDGAAEIPELMAKASVIYNPVVYALMNSGFRKTVKRLFRRHSCYSNSEDSRVRSDIDMATVKILFFKRKSSNSKE